MIYTKWRSTVVAIAFSMMLAQLASAETIIKLSIGATGPDVVLEDGLFSTVDDGVTTQSPGQQQTTIDFDGFVESEGGLTDITIPNQGSFTLTGIQMSGGPIVKTLGPFTRIDQATTGGSFELYDETGAMLLTGTMTDGLLTGTPGDAAAGSLFSASFGTFTGPTDAPMDKLFSLLDPSSMSLSLSLTDIIAPDSTPGIRVLNGAVANFTADATGNISAVATPEPGTLGLIAAGLMGLLGLRQKRCS